MPTLSERALDGDSRRLSPAIASAEWSGFAPLVDEAIKIAKLSSRSSSRFGDYPELVALRTLGASERASSANDRWGRRAHDADSRLESPQLSPHARRSIVDEAAEPADAPIDIDAAPVAYEDDYGREPQSAPFTLQYFPLYTRNRQPPE